MCPYITLGESPRPAGPTEKRPRKKVDSGVGEWWVDGDWWWTPPVTLRHLTAGLMHYLTLMQTPSKQVSLHPPPPSFPTHPRSSLPFPETCMQSLLHDLIIFDPPSGIYIYIYIYMYIYRGFESPRYHMDHGITIPISIRNIVRNDYNVLKLSF